MPPIAVLVCLGALLLSTCSAAIVNREVIRIIDATNAIVKLTAEIKAAGLKGEYVLTFPTREARCISHLAVSIKGKALPVSAPVSVGNTTSYTVTVKDAVATLKVAAVLTAFLEPFPAEITQLEQQVTSLPFRQIFPTHSFHRQHSPIHPPHPHPRSSSIFYLNPRAARQAAGVPRPALALPHGDAEDDHQARVAHRRVVLEAQPAEPGGLDAHLRALHGRAGQHAAARHGALRQQQALCQDLADEPRD